MRTETRAGLSTKPAHDVAAIVRAGTAAAVACLSCSGQQISWRELQMVAHRSYDMTYDLRRGRHVAVSAGRTIEWDGAAWHSCSSPHAPESRCGHRLVYDTVRGRVLLFGGRARTACPQDLWEYDGVDWLQHQPATAPVGRTDHAMTFDLQRGRCVLFGGETGQATQLGDTWEWDGAAWTAFPIAAPAARHGAAMAFH